MKNVPKIKKRSRGYTAHYNILLTPEMRTRLYELRQFEGIDTAEWIRQMITKGLADYDKSKQLKQV